MSGIKIKGLSSLKRLCESDANAALKMIATSMSEEALNLIGDGFRSGTDPYGKAWNAPNNLQITGFLRSYAVSSVTPKGFKVAPTDVKAQWHHDPQPRPQWGGKSLPQRLQFPVEGRGLPDKWRSRLESAGSDALSSALGQSKGKRK